MDSEDTLLYYQGSSLQLAKQYRDAIAPLMASFKLAPHSKTAQLLGECYLELGQIEDAILYLAAAVGLGPRPQAAYLLAEAFMRSDMLADAEKAAKTAIEQLPHYKKAQMLLEQIVILRKSRGDAAYQE